MRHDAAGFGVRQPLVYCLEHVEVTKNVLDGTVVRKPVEKLPNPVFGVHAIASGQVGAARRIPYPRSTSDGRPA
jgi:hypothetical protein